MPRHTPHSRRMRRRHLQHTFSWRRPGRVAVGLVSALLAVVCLAAFAMATRLPTAHGSAATHVSRQFVGPEGTPDVARWQDEAQKTAFSIACALPRRRPRKAPPVRPVRPASAQPLATPIALRCPPATRSSARSFQPGNPTGISTWPGAGWRVWRQAVHNGGCNAELALRRACPGCLCPDRFVVASSVDSAAQLAALCKKATGNTFTMQSGCDPSGVCVDPVATASVALPKYENQLVAANNATSPSQSTWLPVYASSSSVIRGQYSNGQFADAMARAIEKVGKITAITPVAETIAVQTSATGQTYSSRIAPSRSQRNGQTSTRTIASYYLLEGGEWHFWFSA